MIMRSSPSHQPCYQAPRVTNRITLTSISPRYRAAKPFPLDWPLRQSKAMEPVGPVSVDVKNLLESPNNPLAFFPPRLLSPNYIPSMLKTHFTSNLLDCLSHSGMRSGERAGLPTKNPSPVPTCGILGITKNARGICQT